MPSWRFYIESILDTTHEPERLAQLKEINYERKGYLWIDSLRINQSDLQEHASQVTLMGRI
jgi:hypothetical protein